MITINGDMVNVVVNVETMNNSTKVQIEDIVHRKTEILAEKIIISTVAQ